MIDFHFRRRIVFGQDNEGEEAIVQTDERIVACGIDRAIPDGPGIVGDQLALADFDSQVSAGRVQIVVHRVLLGSPVYCGCIAEASAPFEHMLSRRAVLGYFRGDLR